MVIVLQWPHACFGTPHLRRQTGQLPQARKNKTPRVIARNCFRHGNVGFHPNANSIQLQSLSKLIQFWLFWIASSISILCLTTFLQTLQTTLLHTHKSPRHLLVKKLYTPQNIPRECCKFEAYSKQSNGSRTRFSEH